MRMAHTAYWRSEGAPSEMPPARGMRKVRSTSAGGRLRVPRAVRLRDQPVILFVSLSHSSKQLLAFA